MVKVGAMFLNNGVWKGQRIISGPWVEKSAAAFPVNQGIDVPGEDGGKLGYAYSWWTKQYSDSGQTINMFCALGWGGQKIMVLPEVNTVVVFTGGSYTSEVKNFSILEKYIIPALS
jgi:CubicO group peptidase (beta-lactamase class C family)